MTPDPRAPHTSRDALPAEDRALVARIDAHFAPPPQTAAQRARFEARLAARLHRVGRWHRVLRGAAPLATAVATACLAWLIWVAPERAPETASTPPGPPRLLSEWERSLVLGDLDALEREETEALALPADYAAIDGLLFEDS